MISLYGNIQSPTVKTFTQGEKVMIRRLGNDKEYRAIIVGISNEHWPKGMIIEMVDPIHGAYKFTHCVITEVCIDQEPW